MTHKKLWSAAMAIIVVVVAGAVWTLAASAEPSGRPAPPGEYKEAKPVEQTRLAAGPGIQAMVAASTDIIIADVLETNPHKAIEGARDTVKLKVVRTLLGRPAAGDILGVYYHLRWSDEKSEILELSRSKLWSHLLPNWGCRNPGS